LLESRKFTYSPHTIKLCLLVQVTDEGAPQHVWLDGYNVNAFNVEHAYS